MFELLPPFSSLPDAKTPTNCRSKQSTTASALGLVKLRFFAGLTLPEIAQVFKISLATAERHWTYARTWLFAELKDRDDSAKT